MSWLSRFRRGAAEARIAPVSREQAARLAEIHAGAFARPWGEEEFESYLADRAIRIDGLFLGRDRSPAGFIVSRTVLDEAEILSLALARPVRGRGYSRRLLSAHLQALAYARVARVHLEVEEGNAPALALYRRLGFFQSGTRPGYYARPDGSRASAISMTRILQDQPAVPAR